MTSLPKGRKRGASILLLSLVFMIILLLLSVTLFQIIPSELHAANRSHENLNGHYVARAGLQDALSWLENRMQEFEATQDETVFPDYTLDNGATYPNIVAYTAAANAKRPFTKGNWWYEIEISPQQHTMGLASNLEPRLYAVRSTAYQDGRPIRKIDALFKQSTFASFAFFSDEWDPNTPLILTGDTQFFGPIHTNDFWNFDTAGLSGGAGTWSGNDPAFTDLVTHAGIDTSSPDKNTWTGGAPYDANGSPIPGQYEQVFQDGRTDLRQKNTIELPSSTSAVLDETWPDPNTRPASLAAVSTDGSNRVNGGIYVAGDAEKVNLRLDQYGNQKTVISQVLSGGATSVQKWKYIPYTPPQYGTWNKCVEWGPPPSGGGGGGGAGGGGLNPPCIKWEPQTYEKTQKVPDGTELVTDYDPFEIEVYEVTEQDIEINWDINGDGTVDPSEITTGESGMTGGVPDGNASQTVVVTKQYDEEHAGGAAWRIIDVQVHDGQINGNIYVDGNIGNGAGRSWSWEDPDGGSGSSEGSTAGVQREGLWGITKGSAVVDPNGNYVLDSNGNRTYANKAVVTPLDKSVSLGGDLLQFDPVRFQANAGADFEDLDGNGMRNWVTLAALDPNASGGAELSANNDHVLGIITLDLWMNGPRDGNGSFDREHAGVDGVNNVYAVALAGQNQAGTTSGGFGTWYSHRNNTGDGLGAYQIIGGIIQGTVDNNPGTPGNRTHHWVDASGSVGYDVNMVYDIEATRQRIFPVQADFSIIRMFETSARS